MKKMFWVGFLLILAMIVGLPNLYSQQQGGWYCPWMGGGGMMEQGGMMTQQRAGQPVNNQQAKRLLEDYLRNRNNPNLKLGEFTEKGNVYEATIVTKEGSLVERIQVDKTTGWFRNIP